MSYIVRIFDGIAAVHVGPFELEADAELFAGDMREYALSNRGDGEPRVAASVSVRPLLSIAVPYADAGNALEMLTAAELQARGRITEVRNAPDSRPPVPEAESV